MSETPAPSNDTPRMKTWIALCAIPCLMGLSALLAQAIIIPAQLPIPYAAGVLIYNAIPWFLQYAAIALLLVLLNRVLIQATPPQVNAALGLPLLMGLVYWSWTIARLLPSTTALDIATDKALEGMRHQLAGIRLPDVLYGFNSLLVSPLHLLGPLIEMSDIRFVLAGLSTLLVTVYWLFAAKWIGIGDRNSKVSHTRQWFRFVLAMLVYFLPVLFDSAFKLMRLAHEMQQ